MFKRKETKEEIQDRLLDLCENVDCGIFNRPMSAQVALNELQRHFLGEDWYVNDSLCQEQVNAQIVYEIELKHRKRISRK